MGGMIADRQFCLAGMILLMLRGIEKEEVAADVHSNAKQWKKEKGRGTPLTVELPWYAFDMHTQAGKIAMSIFMRHSADKYDFEDREEFGRVWFYLESAKTPKHLLRIKTLTDKLTAFDSAWWLPFISKEIRYNGRSPKRIPKCRKTLKVR